MARKKSELLSAMGTMFEISKALTDAVLERGGDDEDLRKILKDRSLASKIASLIVGATTPTFSRDMRKEGWTLLERGPKRTINSIADLELVSPLRKGEDRIHGEEMIRRARAELGANLGQEDAEWLLVNQHTIPKEWRNYCLVFPETVWQDSHGDRNVPYLYWFGDRWCLGFRWLEGDWSSCDRLVRKSMPADRQA